MSYDALMRWEWEGGAAAAVSERDETGHNEPRASTQVVVPQAIPPELAATDV